jgi:hypothetical protein
MVFYWLILLDVESLLFASKLPRFFFCQLPTANCQLKKAPFGDGVKPSFFFLCVLCTSVVKNNLFWLRPDRVVGRQKNLPL